jgi:hypothetical protein
MNAGICGNAIVCGGTKQAGLPAEPEETKAGGTKLRLNQTLGGLSASEVAGQKTTWWLFQMAAAAYELVRMSRLLRVGS